MFQRILYIILVYLLVDNICIAAENDNRIQSRLKRYEQFSEEEIPDDWAKSRPSDEECDGWLQCLMDFFFGAADMARGHPGGVFTRMMDWVKKTWCRMTNQCDDSDPYPEPSPDFIRPTVASSNPQPADQTTTIAADPEEPSAEEVTETVEEKKDANDVQ
ncbi:hypothetical protein O3M35_007142 [Rhynocoris fuscipes]|uniref:Uncharacterized protein n=1 Tax=Rhynocoris fuscipes TaxID=488301 RepID=A0AAW1DDZ5_9HEMI